MYLGLREVIHLSARLSAVRLSDLGYLHNTVAVYVISFFFLFLTALEDGVLLPALTQYHSV